jgi:hypothetical protein
LNRRRGGLAGLAVSAALCAAALAPAGAGAGSLKLGLFDGPYPTSEEHALWLDRSWDAGARLVQVGVSWAQIAPETRPAGFNPANPADPRYRFATLDSVVREAAARGFQVVFFVTGAPTWAQGAGRPARPESAAWKPDAAEYGLFARALASRYSGTFTDPLRIGAALPRVRYFRVWNEPNLTIYLSPQWAGRRPVGPDRYRSLLNAAYAGIKAVNRSNVVIAGGLAPYGDDPGEERMRPVTFLRRLFCLRTFREARARNCKGPARFDVLSHNPINQFQPWRSARTTTDATTPDLGRLRSVLRVARRLGTVKPRSSKPLWVTEFWWASNPPTSFGVSRAKQARWLEYALYLFWKQGVKVAIWLGISDPGSDMDGVGYGLYTNAGEPKPALRAYRFPFVAERSSAGSAIARAWGRTPVAGTVQIQVQSRRGWRTVRRVRRRAPGVFTARLRVPAGAKLRAQLTPSNITSLPWKVNVAHRISGR